MARPTSQLPSTEAYDRWAAIYDTDGNILQSLDTYELFTILLPRLIHSLSFSYLPRTNKSSALRITDLGCGTGRATLSLLAFLQQASDTANLFNNAENSNGGLGKELHITGLDASRGMLEVSRGRVSKQSTIQLMGSHKTSPDDQPFHIDVSVKAGFHQYDILSPPGDLPAALAVKSADTIICSLVIEHLPSLETFFHKLVNRGLLKLGGLLLLTNMHPDMAKGATGTGDPVAAITIADDGSGFGTHNVTGAGFTDTVTGSKIRVAESYAHTIEQVLVAAKTVGFEVIHGVEETAVEQWMIDKGIVDAERGKKWVTGGVKCWFGMLLRLGRILEE